MKTKGMGIPSKQKGLMVAMAAVLGSGLLLSGCDDDDSAFEDLTAPAIPNGVYTVTADQAVYVRWNPNQERDLAGYLVLSNEDGGAEYFVIADIGPDEYYVDGGNDGDPGNDYIEFPDLDVVNGNYYWYAIAAYDFDGNESALSLETVVDVPRPEGFDLFVEDRATDPNESGVDFSDLRGGAFENAQAWNDPATDFYYEVVDGIPYLVAAPSGVRLQDYGYVSFDVASYSPLEGWSEIGRSEAILGHTYLFEIAEPGAPAGDVHYAKVEITSLNLLDPSPMGLSWGYQAVPNERELKAVSRTGGASRTKK